MAPGGPAPETAPLVPRKEPENPASGRENVRGHIASIVVALFAVLVLGRCQLETDP